MNRLNITVDNDDDDEIQQPPPVTFHYASDADSDDEDNLPYPGELARKDFLTPDFDPQTYLSSLRNRHQTLEDLRSDLRQRSQLLNQELVDLVNNNYEEFLSLGADLKGGEEKVEGVRVGLLGFEREVGAIQRAVTERRERVGDLVRERKEVRNEIVLGRSLLELHRAIEDLEETLGIKPSDVEESDEVGLDGVVDEDEESDAAGSTLIQKHRRRTEEFVLLHRQSERLPADHPFVEAQVPRIAQIKSTLLLDLRTVLDEATKAQAQDTTLAVLKLYATLDAEADGIRAVKGS